MDLAQSEETVVSTRVTRVSHALHFFLIAIKYLLMFAKQKPISSNVSIVLIVYSIRGLYPPSPHERDAPYSADAAKIHAIRGGQR